MSINTLQDRRRIGEKGQASVELVLILPLLVMMIVGMLVIGRLLYIHLALITATNDCATAAAQAVRSDQAYRQGNAARSQSLATFAVPQDNPGGLGFSNDATCQTGYSGSEQWFFWGGGTWHPRVFTIYYQFSQPLQPYKSDWRGVE
ncbi:MAG: pilus assembly protein [Anaerolineales bacterium]|nr:pilus assembly protein [Anaerolineales bacterium]